MKKVKKEEKSMVGEKMETGLFVYECTGDISLGSLIIAGKDSCSDFGDELANALAIINLKKDSFQTIVTKIKRAKKENWLDWLSDEGFISIRCRVIINSGDIFTINKQKYIVSEFTQDFLLVNIKTGHAIGDTIPGDFSDMENEENCFEILGSFFECQDKDIEKIYKTRIPYKK
jgi:hypothetical protein